MKISLRHRLLKILILLLVVMGSITIWSSYQDAADEVQELFDAELARSARLILALSQSGFANINLEQLQTYLQENRLIEANAANAEQELLDGHPYELKIMFQVFNERQELILKTDNAPATTLSDLLTGYTDIEWNGNLWRTFVVWNRMMEYKIVVAESYEVRSELIDKIVFKLLIPFLIMLPLLAWLMWWAIGQGLKPLKAVTRRVAQLDEKHLDPLQVERVPEEIQPLVAALNKLFERLRTSFENERRFSADAAHELRTPLAALRTHVQLLQADTAIEKHRDSLVKIMQAVDRAAHVVDQLMNLVKYDEGSMVPELRMLDLRKLTTQVVADLIPFALEKDIEVSVAEFDDSQVYGDEAALGMLVRNLVDNAIRYTQAGGKVDVSFRRAANSLSLYVQDNGPGIEDGQYEKVFERFHRGEGHVLSGCGIGMAIVKEIAQLHMAEIILKKSVYASGLNVEVRFAV